MLLWKRYGNNNMAAMRYYVLHLQQYSHRLNLLYFSFSFGGAIQSFMLFCIHLSFTLHGHLPAADKVQEVESVKFSTHMLVTLRTILTQLKNYWYQREKELKMRQLWLYAFI